MFKASILVRADCEISNLFKTAFLMVVSESEGLPSNGHFNIGILIINEWTTGFPDDMSGELILQ